MKEDLMLLMRMPWRHRGIMMCLSSISFLVCFNSYDSNKLIVKGVLFTIILLVASYYDFRTRIIPEWIHLLIIFVGLIDFSPLKSFSGLLITPLPFLFIALLHEGSIGGGDIKLIGVMGFVWGLTSTIFPLVLGLIFAIYFTLLYYFKKRYKCNLSFPLIPYIFLAWILLRVT